MITSNKSGKHRLLRAVRNVQQFSRRIGKEFRKAPFQLIVLEPIDIDMVEQPISATAR